MTFLTIGITIINIRTHAMSHRVKSPTPSIIVELQNFLNRLVVGSPHLGRVDKFKPVYNHGNGASRWNGNCPRYNGVGKCGNGKPRKRPRPSEPEDNLMTMTRASAGNKAT
jgi:hypothetical protein